MPVSKSSFGTTSRGEEVTRFVFENANGYILEMINYGATITKLVVPDKKGIRENIVLACDSIEAYEAHSAYFGATVGRVCNRTRAGKFSINGTEYTLAQNNGPNHLHGGLIGFDRRVWDTEVLDLPDATGVRFSLVSDDGDEGYPGKLSVSAEYVLNDNNELIMDFRASTDATTHVNLTNHSYWNLGGVDSGDILSHQLQIEADQYVPVDAASIPTGELAPVENAPFDFRTPQPIGSRFEQLDGVPTGYDHNYVLRNPDNGLRSVVVVCDPESGRQMEVLTTQPGIQLYTGNYMKGDEASAGFETHHGFCLETQGFPNAANQSNFPPTLLHPGETYHHVTIHRFSVRS